MKITTTTARRLIDTIDYCAGDVSIALTQSAQQLRAIEPYTDRALARVIDALRMLARQPAERQIATLGRLRHTLTTRPSL